MEIAMRFVQTYSYQSDSKENKLDLLRNLLVRSL